MVSLNPMGNEEQGVRVVLVTVPSVDVGKTIARELVRSGKVGCANVLPGLTSIYVWEGELCEDSEALLILKASAQAIPELERALLALHPYTTPEFVVLEAAHVEPSYQAWLLGPLD